MKDLAQDTSARHARILLLDDERRRINYLAERLRRRGLSIAELCDLSGVRALKGLGEGHVVITHDRLAGQDVLTLLDHVHEENPSATIVLITSAWSTYLARALGTRPYLWLRQEPVDPNELEVLVTSLTEPRKPALRHSQRSSAGPAADGQTPETPRTEDCLALLAHELRSPLQAMTAWVEIVKSVPSDSERFAKAIAAIERSIAIQAGLLTDVGSLPELIEGTLRIELNRLDVAKLVADVVEFIAPDAERRRVRLTHECPDGPVFVMGDGARLGQAIRNVLGNALKFTPAEGYVRVITRANGRDAEVLVSDTGPGLDPAILTRVFDRFFQGDLGRPKQGLGLGLYIVRQIVVAHGGTVSAGSKGSNAGATFQIRIPLAPTGEVAP